MFRIGIATLGACLLVAAPTAAQTNPGQQGALNYLEQQITAQNGVLADQARQQEAVNATVRQTGRAQALVRIGCGSFPGILTGSQLASSLRPLGYSALAMPLSTTTCALLNQGVAAWTDAQSTVADVSGDLMNQIGTGVQTLTTKTNAFSARIATGVAVSSGGSASARGSGRTLQVRGRAGAHLRHLRVTFKGRTLHDRRAGAATVRVPTAGLRPGAHRVTIVARDHLGRRWQRHHWIYVPVRRR